MKDISKGIQFLHNRDPLIIHRDLKVKILILYIFILLIFL